MAKKMINEKITNTHQVTLECVLNADELVEGVLKGEFEDVGEVDLATYFKKFSGENVKITITNKVEEVTE